MLTRALLLAACLLSFADAGPTFGTETFNGTYKMTDDWFTNPPDPDITQLLLGGPDSQCSSNGWEHLTDIISGTLPDAVWPMSKLTEFEIKCANISGTIPSTPWVSLSNQLTRFDLEKIALLSGTVPASLGLLTKLTYLDLSHNLKLSGTLPGVMLTFKKLSYFLVTETAVGGGGGVPIAEAILDGAGAAFQAFDSTDSNFSPYAACAGGSYRATINEKAVNLRQRTYQACLLAPCYPGEHQTTAGKSSCSRCEAGRFQDQFGQAACSACSAGAYAAQTGQVACIRCGAGSFAGGAQPAAAQSHKAHK